LPRGNGRRAGLIGFALSAALFVGIGALAVSRIVDLGAANATVEHTLLVRAEAETLMSLLKDAETGQRGFIITGQQQYIEPYNAAVVELPKRVANFRRLTADSMRQQQNIETFERLAERRLTILREGVAARNDYGFESAAQIVSNGEGKRVMDAARATVSQILQEEDRLLRERGLAQRDRSNAVAAASLGSLLLAFVLLVIATFFVARR
jgi:CHASE3 domain sensor protein